MSKIKKKAKAKAKVKVKLKTKVKTCTLCGCTDKDCRHPKSWYKTGECLCTEVKAKREGAVKRKSLRTWSPLHIQEREFKKLEISARFQELLGLPSPNFSSIIYGLANNGKSPFCVQLAQELASFGKVLYISSEELIGATLQERLKLNNITSPRIRFVGARTVEDIERLILSIHPRFIIIDSVQICNMTFNDFTRLKNVVCKNRKGFHLVSQTSNKGKPLLPQKWSHEVDAKICVKDGVATCVSRFKSSGRMVVFQKQASHDLFNQPVTGN